MTRHRGWSRHLQRATGAVRVFDVVDAVGRYVARIGSQEVDLPLVPIADDLAIALLITVDHGVRFAERAGAELADHLAPFRAEVVVSVATMGIPLAIEATRALGLDDYLILQKTPKIHLQDAISEPVTSITTGTSQRLLFDRSRVSAAAGRRVAVVDDVISTGASVGPPSTSCGAWAPNRWSSGPC